MKERGRIDLGVNRRTVGIARIKWFSPEKELIGGAVTINLITQCKRHRTD